jgi:hypothetical protein
LRWKGRRGGAQFRFAEQFVELGGVARSDQAHLLRVLEEGRFELSLHEVGSDSKERLENALEHARRTSLGDLGATWLKEKGRV